MDKRIYHALRGSSRDYSITGKCESYCGIKYHKKGFVWQERFDGYFMGGYRNPEAKQLIWKSINCPECLKHSEIKKKII